MLALTFVACEKEENEEEPASSVAPQALQPNVGDSPEAILVALQISATQDVPIIGPTTIVTGSAVASFPDNNGNGQDAGTVTVDGSTLSYNNGAYVYTPSATDPSGLDFGSSIPWTVQGKGNVAGFNETYARSVPSIGAVSGAEASVSRSSSLSLGIDASDINTNIASADSLLFVVYDNSGKYILKTQAISQTTATFSASELGTLAAGAGYIQVNAYNFEVRDVSGAEVVFINQGSTTLATEWK